MSQGSETVVSSHVHVSGEEGMEVLEVVVEEGMEPEVVVVEDMQALVGEVEVEEVVVVGRPHSR